jgi:ppGpp synthetase/RelA/SpoT-type nucleotidyltranferase
MPLPVTKGEFNRLGDRLISHERPAEADVTQLRAVLAAYQEVLGQVKVHLRDLGFAPTDRVKTTTTMIDKLRRTHGMELSRVQDLAGARITVVNLAAQDAAKDEITEFYTVQGCRWRETDRRRDPRYGYRALHLVVWLDGLPVEIQIRTELQDTWAQIVERLADRWGRGIRYGQDPEAPDAVVRLGGSVSSRREAVALLMQLSDAVAGVEDIRQSVEKDELMLQRLGKLVAGTKQMELDPLKLVRQVLPETMDSLAPLVKVLADSPEQLDNEGLALLAAGANLTNAQMLRVLEMSHDVLTRTIRERAVKHQGLEEQLRGILRLIASARDEGV